VGEDLPFSLNEIINKVDLLVLVGLPGLLSLDFSKLLPKMTAVLSLVLEIQVKLAAIKIIRNLFQLL
jgi:hypothetical protein